MTKFFSIVIGALFALTILAVLALYFMYKSFLLIFLYTVATILFIISFRLSKSNLGKQSNIVAISICLGFLIFDVFFLFLQNRDEQIRRERNGLSDTELREYSADYPSGYLFKNGIHVLSENIYLNGVKIPVYERVEYQIINNVRSRSNLNNANFCPNVILLGGSHNFGQALNFNNTLQGYLAEDGYTILNLSIPGFGLSNSLALLKTGFFREYLEINCIDERPLAIVYRFIPDHILRDAGKTALNLRGPNLRTEDNQQFKANCNTISSCVQYLAIYIPARFMFYLKTTQNEKSALAIYNLLSPIMEFTDNDFKITKNILNELSLEASKLKVPSTIIVQEPPVVAPYNEIVREISGITLLEPSDYANQALCKETKYKVNYIPFEGHPTDCLNFQIYHKLKEIMKSHNLD